MYLAGAKAVDMGEFRAGYSL